MVVARCVALLLVASCWAGVAQAETLWFVGDGSSTNPASAMAGPTRWAMSPDGHGNDEATFTQLGVQDESTADNNAVPTFVWPDPIAISAAQPVTVHMFVEDPFGGFCGGMDGQLFDGAGKVLGPAAGLLVDTTGGPGTVEELVFAFEGIAGEFQGLQFQIGGHWTDCSSLPYTFSWGSDASPARLEYAVPSAAPAAAGPTYANLTTPHLSFGQTNLTSGTYQFNFTHADSPVEFTFNVTGNGTVVVQVLDGTGNATFNQTFEQGGNGTAAFAGAVPGNWSYVLQLTNFTGTVTLDLQAPEPAPVATGSSSSTSSTSATATATSSNSTTTTSDSAETPFPAVGLVVLALGLVVRRRRA